MDISSRRPALPRLPELLAPAGSPDALEAALGAGADAVYLGGSAFNARMNAHNFDKAELTEAVASAHRMGGRIYLTLNTLIWDRELTDAVRAAYEAASVGVDALIIADAGAAALTHEALPSLPLHASTQFSGHNSRIGAVLSPYGFSRVVIARETPLEDLRAAVRENPLEVEVFIHGALCVCHSGQCLFSSLVGGRSGNRGECAQPCRLPYRCGGTAARADVRPLGRGGDQRRTPAEEYPLSLKDLSLAEHVPALIDAGVASLKIEGRMKSADYVGGVTSVWRRLLDERRAADADEMRYLADLFSRGGFTDGYFTGRVDHRMMGVRSEDDKERSAHAGTGARAGSFLPVSLNASVRAGEPVTLTASAPLFRWERNADDEKALSVTLSGPVPDTARNPDAALTRDALCRQLAKTGGTAYTPADVTAEAEPGLLLPLSRLNALRREVLEALDEARMNAMPRPAVPYRPEAASLHDARADGGVERPLTRTARFLRAEQITDEARAYFSVRYLPLRVWGPADAPAANGVVLPPVVFDREADRVKAMLAEAIRTGARHILVGNPGHFALVRETLDALGPDAIGGISVHGDFRLNVTNVPALDRTREMAALALSGGNGQASAVPEGLMLSDVLLSPELTLPRLRGLCRARPESAAAIVYGRLPLMLLEKCAIRELYPDSRSPSRPNGKAGSACAACAGDKAALCDRRGVTFPIVREFDHRSVILNSIPVSMTDRQDELNESGVRSRHYIFTVEPPRGVDQVIRADREGAPVGGDVRRIK